MKKITELSYLLFFLFIFAGCNQGEENNGYTINGTIKGIDSGMVKLLKNNQENRTSATVDSIEFKDGKFTLNGAVKSPEMMTVLIEPGKWSFTVFVENSKITVEADTSGSRYYDWTTYGGSKGAEIKNYTITGSANQDNWQKYEDDPGLNVYQPELEKLQKQFEAASASGNREEENDLRNQIDSLVQLRFALQINWIDSFVNKNPSSAAGAYMLNQYYMFKEDYPLKDMKGLLSKFSGEAKSSAYYDILQKAADKRDALQPGNTAPDFTLLQRDSSAFTLSSLRGKYVLLDFWASWCVPCRKSIPHWKEVYQKYAPQGFEIVGITNDSRWSDWYKALDEEKMPWIQVADEFPRENMPARLATQYMIPYLPTYILLDKEGKILLHNASKEEIDGKLAGIFNSVHQVKK